MFKNISNFGNTSDYLPLFNGVLITDLLVILFMHLGLIPSLVLKEWYAKYNLSAVITDVLIIFIGLIIARAIYYYFFDTFSILRFTFLAVIIQVIHDYLFYLFFSAVPRGFNHMLDTFKDYANEVSYKAIIADSMMMISSSLIGSYLAGTTLNTNLIILVVSAYLVPYFIYQA